jgi:5-methylcytosine-specific restriction protein A
MAKPQYRGPWQSLRRAVLARDNHECQLKGPRCTGRATQVDHVIPIADGGSWWSMGNLVASCARCNFGKAARRTNALRAQALDGRTPSRDWFGRGAT